MADQYEKVEGGCLCGDVRFIARDPGWAGHCHCSMCQKFTGSAFQSAVRFSRDSFEWTKGKPTQFISSGRSTRGFCSRCGSSLTWEEPDGFYVLLGSLDQPNSIQPEGHVWMKTSMPWLKLADGLPQSDGPPPGVQLPPGWPES